MFYNIFLNWVFMIKTRFYQVVHEAEEKLLRILLTTISVVGHDFSHERFYHLCLGVPRLVGPFYVFHINTQNAFLALTELIMTFIGGAVFMKRYCMGQTLHNRIKETSISPILHSKCDSPLLINAFTSHQFVHFLGGFTFNLA